MVVVVENLSGEKGPESIDALEASLKKISNEVVNEL